MYFSPPGVNAVNIPVLDSGDWLISPPLLRPHDQNPYFLIKSSCPVGNNLAQNYLYVQIDPTTWTQANSAVNPWYYMAGTSVLNTSSIVLKKTFNVYGTSA